MARTALALLVALLALGTLTASAAGDTVAIIDDCQDGVLDGRYSGKDLREAKGQLQGDLTEYSDCTELINRALSPTGGEANAGGGNGAGGLTGGGTGTGGGATDADPAAFTDERGVRRDASGVPVDQNGAQVDPLSFAPETQGDIDAARRGIDVASAGVRPDDPGTSLPAPLIALLVVCALAAAAAAATGLRRLGPLRRGPRPA
jgi:hypothetical protein